MRYVPSGCLSPGQKIAVDLKMCDDRVFIRNGMVLNGKMIERLRTIGFQGVYIDDEISKDLKVANIVSDELMYKAKDEIRSFFIDTGTGKSRKKKAPAHLKTIRLVIGDMVDEILQNRKVMVNIVDLRTYDDYTFCHCLNVAILSVVLGTVMKLDRTALQELAMGAMVHDIGKIFIDKSILNKKGKLTGEEYEIVKGHVQRGFDYLSQKNDLTENAMKTVLEHHEKYDGSGYPNGLRGKDIHIFGRISAVSDVYDALVSNRPYRGAMLPSDAVEYIMSGFGNMFDPVVVKAFIQKVAPYPVGTCVLLSNGVQGIVTENFESAGMRPRVQVIAGGKATKEYIDLKNDMSTLNITVQKVLNL